MNAYRVCWTVLVDHPELRGSTYAPARAGTAVHYQKTTDYRTAIAIFEGLCRGEDDFASEYVCSAYVHAVDGQGRPARTVRRRVELNEERGRALGRAALARCG